MMLDEVLFLPLSQISGMAVDKVSLGSNKLCLNVLSPQIRYVILFLVSIFLGFFMKYSLHPSRVSGTVRHCYSFVLGLVFGLICFGPLYV